MKATLIKATYTIDSWFHVRDDSRDDLRKGSVTWSFTLCNRLVQFEKQSSQRQWCEECWTACARDELKSAVAVQPSEDAEVGGEVGGEVGRRHRRKRHKHKKRDWLADRWDRFSRAKPKLTVVVTQKFDPPRLITPEQRST